MNDIIIGKHTLESLTTGMYTDPFVIFREYIQNSSDSIDDAYEAGILHKGSERIEITLSPAEHQISICDNGLGVSSALAEKTLLSIGNSKKASENSRGFRGIGRLSALSYCKTLTFITTMCGENIGTCVIIDATKLSTLLAISENEDISVIEVLRSAYHVEYFAEKIETHYFKVMLNGVDDSAGINNYPDVVSYISQNAPVPYNHKTFTWGREIEHRFQREGFHIHQYNIFLTYANQTVQIYKPYCDSFIVDNSKNIIDKIYDVKIIHTTQPNGTIAAIGWIAKTNYLGSIYDKAIKGIRLRTGNILIGDSKTLNVIFKDARFNGWSIGEIFIVHHKLIPNARRDNFEKNSSYFLLTEQLTNIASGIIKEIRSTSLKRNIKLTEAIEQSDQVKKDAIQAIKEGVDTYEKGVIKQKITYAQTSLAAAPLNNDQDSFYQEIAFEELDMLIGKLQGTTSFKAINTLSTLSKTEKKILERVFNVIVNSKFPDSNSLIEKILEDFSKKVRNTDKVD